MYFCELLSKKKGHIANSAATHQKSDIGPGEQKYCDIPDK